MYEQPSLEVSDDIAGLWVLTAESAKHEDLCHSVLGTVSKPCLSSVTSANLGVHLEQQCPPGHREKKGWSGVHTCKVPVFAHPASRTVPWPQTPEPVSAFLETGYEAGLSSVVSTSGRAGLVSAD